MATQSSSSINDSEYSTSEYSTIWTSPPKKPSGRTKFRETRHPVYRGVRRRGTSERWVCEVRNPNNKSRIWLGTFPTADMAARAHDVAVMALLGKSACLNFADSAWLVKLPESFSSVDDIKKAAIEAAQSLSLKCNNGASSSSDNGEKDEEKVDYNNLGFEMDLGSYYEDFAEGILPTADWFGDLDDDQWGSPVFLWS